MVEQRTEKPGTSAKGADKPTRQPLWEPKGTCPYLVSPRPLLPPTHPHKLLIHSGVENLGHNLKTKPTPCGTENRAWVDVDHRGNDGLTPPETCVPFPASEPFFLRCPFFDIAFSMLPSFRWKSGGTKSFPWAWTAAQALPNGGGPTSLGGEESYNLPSHGERENQSGCLHH